MGHITLEQRYDIQSMINANFSNKAIAAVIEKSESTISREIRRNHDRRSGRYKASTAQRKFEKRQKEKTKHIRFTTEMKDEVETLLREDLSPEQVVGKRRKEALSCVSHERIYQHIWEDQRGVVSFILIYADEDVNTKKEVLNVQEEALFLTE